MHVLETDEKRIEKRQFLLPVPIDEPDTVPVHRPSLFKQYRLSDFPNPYNQYKCACAYIVINVID